MKTDVIVVGGGASGLAAAICAARRGARVLVLERMPKIGKKLLATGNGRCNYTNLKMNEHCYHSQNLKFVKSILNQFNAEDTLRFFEDLGILPKSIDGYVYPNSLQAASILDCLRFECEYLNIAIKTDQNVTHIRKDKKGFHVTCGDIVYLSQRLILACGGRASSKLGSDGSGYRLSEELGHHVIPVVPALTGLKAKEKIYKSLSGIRTEAKVTLYIDHRYAAHDRGEVQLAEYGISGIPVFQLSGQAAYGLENHKDVRCELDFFPDLPYKALCDLLRKRFKRFKGRPAEVFETGFLNRKLMDACMKLACSDKSQRLPSPEQLADLLKKFPASIRESRGYEFAQVCAGGVDLNEISNESCASKRIPGLYIVGELLDADGICGGYNLQWAWATGYLAGNAAGKDNYDSN